MTEFFRKNRILIVGMMIPFLLAALIIGSRMGVESKNKQVDVVLDYNEIEAMAEQSDHDLSWWLQFFHDELGITKVGLTEENIISLMENADVPVSGELMGIITKEASWQDQYPVSLIDVLNREGFDSFDVLIDIKNTDTSQFVSQAITNRMEPDRYLLHSEGEHTYILLDGTSDMTLFTEKYKEMNSKNAGFMEKVGLEGSKLMYISLGFLPEKVAAIQEAGMEIVPRTLSYSGWNGTRYAEAVLDEYEKYEIHPEYIIVGGEAVIGYDDGTDIASRYLKENGILIGLIENTTQLQNIMQFGVETIAQANEYQTVRVFSVWNYIQNRYQYYGYSGAEEIENTLFRAITERNIRVIYFKPVMEFKDLHTYVTDPQVYKQMFDNLEVRLEEHGITKSSASVMPALGISPILKILLGIGCVFAALLLLDSFLPIGRKGKLLLGVLGIGGVMGLAVIFPGMLELAVSFVAAILFGCLAVTLYTRMSREVAEKIDKEASVGAILPVAAMTLILSVVLAMAGGLMTAAPISSVSYMLEIDIFRGVKVAQLLPLAYFAVAYLACYGFGNRKEEPGKLEILDLKDMLNTSIKVWMVLLATILGALGVYYIMRTGHDSSIQVSSTEMLFRNWLEDSLIARPRTKEFLFAFPAIMLMVYTSVRRLRLWTVVFGLSGAIGVTSVINTFMHIRTPLYLGFFRTGYSLIFGILLGIIAIIVFDQLYRLYIRGVHPYLNDGGKALGKN